MKEPTVAKIIINPNAKNLEEAAASVVAHDTATLEEATGALTDWFYDNPSAVAIVVAGAFTKAIRSSVPTVSAFRRSRK